MTEIDRLPPHSIEAEVCTLGSLMLSTDAALTYTVLRKLTRDSFYLPEHQIIFDAIAHLFRGGEISRAIDAVIVMEELKRRQVFEAAGGTKYLASILNSVPSHVHAEHYADIVSEKSSLRQAITIAGDAMRDAYAPARSNRWANEILVRLCAAAARIASQSADQKCKTLGDVLTATVDSMRQAGSSGAQSEIIPTRFRDIDAAIDGVMLGEMLLIGGRPSMGKSVIARQIALRNAKAGIPTLIFSLEEKDKKIARNILACECAIDNHRLRAATQLTERDWIEIDSGVSRLRDVPLYISDCTRRLEDIQSTAAMMTARHGIKLIAIDYLQLIQSSGRDTLERVSNSSAGVLGLTKDLNVASVSTVQLNRANEWREDKRPTLSDLRASGQIEQDGDIIFLLYRPDYYVKENGAPLTHTAEINIAKMRDGVRNKTVMLRSNFRHQAFEDAEQENPYDPAAFE
jgi:replicative DNA helicase